MRISKITFPLFLLVSSLYAETQRREPSLFLEYEREVKKINDTSKDDAGIFTKIVPPVAKSNTPTVAITKSAPVTETAPKVSQDIETIGRDYNPFMVVSTPVPPKPVLESTSSSETTVTKKIATRITTAKVKLLAKAKEFLGTPYGFGSKNSGRTDCSGFTQQVFSQFGVTLPHSAAEQARLGENVDMADLQVGDLLFYRTYKSDPSHVAIYAGDGKIIHASYNSRQVQFDSIDKAYYKQRFLYAKRLALNDPEYGE